MLPSLSGLSVTIEQKRPREDAEENALRQLIITGPDDVRFECIGEDTNLLFSSSDDDLTSLAVVAYSRFWNTAMNGYLAEKKEDPDDFRANYRVRRRTRRYYHNMSSSEPHPDVEAVFAMFADIDTFLKAFLDPVDYGVIEKHKDGMQVKVTVGARCALSGTLVPADLEADYDPSTMDRIFEIAMRKFRTSFLRKQLKAMRLYDDAVERMISSLDESWRPWLAFYKPEYTNVEKRLKSIIQSKKKRSADVGVSAGAEFEPTTGSWLSWLLGKAGLPSVVVPDPSQPRPKCSRIFNKIPQEFSDCAQTGAVLWTGLKVNVDDIDFGRLSASMRSASLNIYAAERFANLMTFGVVLGLLLEPDVPVISVLDILALRGTNFFCFGRECEVLISHGCTYEFVPGDSLDEQLRNIQRDHPEYYKDLASSEVWNGGTGHSQIYTIRFVTVSAPVGVPSWLPDDWRSFF